jgi:GABA(A) receptor-associated protein
VNKISLQNRKLEAEKILNKHKDKIPVIVEKNYKSDSTPNIDKNKFLVSCDLTLGQFLVIIRKRIKLEKEQSLYTFINDKMIPPSELMQTIYKNNVNEDGCRTKS